MAPKAKAPQATEPEVVATTTGDLFKYYYSNDPKYDSKFYIKNEDVKISVLKLPQEAGKLAFRYMLNIDTLANERVITQSIDQYMYMETYQDPCRFQWIQLITEGPGAGVNKWSILFPDSSAGEPFVLQLKQFLYEASSQMPFAKVAADDVRYCLDANDFAVIDDDVYYDALDDEMDHLGFEGLKLEDEEDDEEEVVETGAGPQRAGGTGSGALNSLLVDSARHKKTFVVKGSSIGVFNRGEDCVYDTEINEVQALDGSKFVPSKIMLHAGDSRLLALNPDKTSKVFCLDLNTEKVVEEWGVDAAGNVNILNFTPTTKYGAVLEEPTIAAMAKNVVMGLDPRLSGPGKSIGDPAKYTQTSNPLFSCCATTAQGHLAVGTSKGEIKFFVGVPGMDNNFSKSATANPKSAKTLLPGFGDPIIGMDVTADGKWVLATCAHYLLLIGTESPTGGIGFVERLGPNKPVPKKLCLSPEDMSIVGTEHSFTPASFNYGKGEMFIVTSHGPYIVTWHLGKVQAGDKLSYVMKKTSDTIMSEQFFAVLPEEDGHDAPIVLAHPEDVSVERRKVYSKSLYQRARAAVFDRSSDPW